MAESHELRLKINAALARSGAKQFVASLASVRKAVTELDRSTTGAFSKLNKGTIDTRSAQKSTLDLQKAAKGVSAFEQAAKRMALQSAAALRTSTSQFDRLYEKASRLGDSQGIHQLDQALARLESRLSRASTPLDIRQARSQFADTASDIMRTNRALELQERQTNIAATSNQAHAASLESLKQKYNPLYAASRQYETALEEISRAESEGVITAQLATDARRRAANELAGLSSATDRHTNSLRRNAAATQQGVMVGHQLSDVLITSQMGFQSVGMIALQQGSQLAAQMNMLKASGGSAMATLLSGVTSLVNPLSLVTIGTVALGAAVAKWAFSAGADTKDFADALSDANTQIGSLQSASGSLANGNIRQLRREYGALNSALDDHLARLKQVAEIEAASANSDLVTSIRDALTSDGNLFTNDIDAIRRAFDTTNDRARTLMDLMQAVQDARTFQEQADAVSRLRQAVESTTGGLGKAEGGARGVLAQLIKAEDAALKLLAAQNGTTSATNNASGAASTLSYTIGTAADEAARLLANLNGVPGALSLMGKSVQGQIAAINAQNKSLNLQIESGLSSAAANRRVQLDTMISTAGNRGQKLSLDQIAAEAEAINKLDAAAKEQARLQKELSALNRPAKKARGGGRGGTAEEVRAIENVTNAIKSRHNALTAEARAMELVSQGTFESIEAARMFAEAQLAGASALDTKTLSMLAQIDAANALSESPAMQLQEGLRESTKAAISSALQGDFDFTSFAQNMRARLADILSERLTDKLFPGLNDGTRAAAQMQAAMAAGGAQAAAQLRAAMTGAGTVNATKTVVAGQQHAAVVGSTIQATGQQHAAAVGAATTGGSAGGGFFSFLGSLFGVPVGKEGFTTSGVSPVATTAVSPAAFRHAPKFNAGTENTAGIPAILHPNEAVVPLSRGRKIPVDMRNTMGGGAVITNTIGDIVTNVTVETDGTADGYEQGEIIAELVAVTIDNKINERFAENMQYGGMLRPRGS